MTSLFDEMINENSETREQSLVFKLRQSISVLYFFIYRHNESKRRLKNVSLASVFLILCWMHIQRGCFVD